MADLLSWLRSTIEGDKAAAEKVHAEVWTAHEEPWEKGEFAMLKIGESGRDGESCGCCTAGTLDPDRAAHMAIHDPRDTIARCEAELALLDRTLPEVRRIAVRLAEEFGGIWPDGKLTSSEKMLLKTLALGYRHRPGFKPEWAEGLDDEEQA